VGPPLARAADLLKCYALSPDGRKAATARDQGVLVWDVETGEAAVEHPLGAQHVFQLQFRGDGRRLLTVGNDTLEDISSGKMQLQVWEVPAGRPAGPPIPAPPIKPGGGPAVLSPDGALAAVAESYSEVQLWDVATGTRLGPSCRLPASWPGGVASGSSSVSTPTPVIAFSPDGATLLTAVQLPTGIKVQRWRVPTGLKEAPEVLTLWAQIVAGTELDAQGAVRGLDAATLEQSRRQLREKGDVADR
jgi:WD40 repeat protein